MTEHAPHRGVSAILAQSVAYSGFNFFGSLPGHRALVRERRVGIDNATEFYSLMIMKWLDYFTLLSSRSFCSAYSCHICSQTNTNKHKYTHTRSHSGDGKNAVVTTIRALNVLANAKNNVGLQRAQVGLFLITGEIASMQDYNDLVRYKSWVEDYIVLFRSQAKLAEIAKYAEIYNLPVSQSVNNIKEMVFTYNNTLVKSGYVVQKQSSRSSSSVYADVTTSTTTTVTVTKAVSADSMNWFRLESEIISQLRDLELIISNGITDFYSKAQKKYEQDLNVVIAVVTVTLVLCLLNIVRMVLRVRRATGEDRKTLYEKR
jgi:hypothetical protein